MREDRLLKQNEALVKLARSDNLANGDLGAIFREVTEAASWALGAARASVWLYDNPYSKLRCVDLFELALERHTEGAELAGQDFPAYFKALEEEHTIEAHYRSSCTRPGVPIQACRTMNGTLRRAQGKRLRPS